MRAFRVGLPLLALLVLASFVAYHTPRSLRGQTSLATQSSGGTVPTHTLFSGLWRVDGGFVSTIRIKNSLVVAPLEVTPVLYMADGTEYDLSPVQLAISGVSSVSVNEALANAPPALAGHLSQFGSAALRYQYPTPGHVLGLMENLNVAKSLIFNYAFGGAEGRSPALQTLEGVWWKRDPGVGGFVSFTNTTDHPAEVSFQVIGSAGTTLAPQSVLLDAHNTEMLDLAALIGGLPRLETEAGGLRIQHYGRLGEIIASGGLENDREGYSASTPFWFHDLGSSTPAKASYASVGLMVGEADPKAGFPRGTRFTPYVALRNTTAKTLEVSPIIYYMSGGEAASVSLPPQQLNPNEAKQVDTVPMLAASGLPDFSGDLNLTLSFTGRTGDLVVATGSVDQTGTYVFEVSPEAVGETLSKQTPYWSVSNGFDTMFTLWNPLEAGQDYIVTFHFTGGAGHYKLPVHLAPKGSVTIDMAELIGQQRPDPEGSVIPADVKDGSATFASVNGVTHPMTLNVSEGTFNVQTATCGIPVCISCCGYSGFTVSPNPLDILVGTTGQATLSATYCDGTSPNLTGSANWGSSAPTVASVQTVGDPHPGLVSAVAYGSATITASINIRTYTGTICSVFPSCPSGTPQISLTARSRETKWAVLRSDIDDRDPICLTALKHRVYQGRDDFGWIPFTELWNLNESLTFKSPDSCRVTIGGTNNNEVGFDDVITTDCQSGCVYEINQTFSVWRPTRSVFQQVPGKNCDICGAHTGWHVKATNSSVTVTDNP